MKQQKPNRPKATKRSRYKIKNWAAYNQALKQRGSLQVWIAPEVEKQWYYQGKSQRGAQYRYSNSCIEMACIVRETYHLGYRQTQGFLQSLIASFGWKVKVPDYSLINRRRRGLHMEVKAEWKMHANWFCVNFGGRLALIHFLMAILVEITQQTGSLIRHEAGLPPKLTQNQFCRHLHDLNGRPSD